MNSNIQKILRGRRVRAKIRGTAEKPRLTVFRSNRSIELQLINDVEGKTIAMATTKEAKGAKGKTQASEEAGKLIAERALKGGIKEAVFDRGHYRYHGRVKAVAEGARKAGLSI
ncbi:MAG: 50S ribosomal protein L18 [Candidatus Colwellbacteria bacterium]|nr:50S ribosomal protein L18 [Candidatus Colwellbacteria bacterium]